MSDRTPVNLDNLIRSTDLAKKLGIHPHCVYRWYAEGRLPGIKLGRRLYFDLDDVQCLFETREPPPRPPRRAKTSRWAREALARMGLGQLG